MALFRSIYIPTVLTITATSRTATRFRAVRLAGQCASVTHGFNNNPYIGLPYNSSNYVSQGVTGVRFQFALGGGTVPVTKSTPWDGAGNVQSGWVDNLGAFLSDLHTYGIVRITPTPAMYDTWSGTLSYPGAYSNCSGAALGFYPWLPFGLANGLPDCQDDNNAYNDASANNSFWTWTPFFTLASCIFQAIQGSGLQLGEFDIQNELDLNDFTVTARLIFDNTTNTDALGGIQWYAQYYGFNRDS